MTGLLAAFALIASAGTTASVPAEPASAGPAVPTESSGAGPVESSAAGRTERSERKTVTELPPRVVRADLLPDPLGPLPLATTVLSRVAIERRPGGDLAELLEPATGLRLASWGGPGGPALPSIRGSTFEQVLVLVDGRRHNPAQGGGVDLTGVPLEGVEAVEVVRGGASALWGSDAIGGAIHVRTRAPQPGTVNVRVAGGSFGQRTLSGSGAIALAPSWAARASGRAYTTNGDYPFVDDERGTAGRIENGDATTAAADARVDGRAGAARVRLDASLSRGDRGVPGSEEFPTPSARIESSQASVGLRLERAVPHRWQPALDVSWLGRRHGYREPGAAFGPINDRHGNRRVTTEASLDRVGDRTVWRFVAGGSIDRLDSTTDGKRRRASANCRARASLDGKLAGRKGRLTGALRVDAVEDFSPFLSPRVAVQIAPTRHTLVRASAGASYRAPSFDELFWPPRATAAGNPDLRAERGRDVDLGVTIEGLPARARVSLDAFARRVDDLIQWVPGASGIWRPRNVGRAVLAGLEAELAARIPLGRGAGLDVTAAGTLLHTDDRTGEPNVHGRELPYRPRLSGSASAILPALGGELETVWRAVSGVWITRANTKTLPGHVRGDVRYRRPLHAGLRLDLGVTNVTNETARDFRDYPLPGRAFVAGISWTRRIP